MREYRFHEFALQVRQRRLLGAGGVAVELTPRLFDALLFLVEHAGELLDKDRLLAELWPGLVVEENSLSQAISGLRKALGDGAQNSRFIQTVPRRGFRFVAPVVVAEVDVVPSVPLVVVAPSAPVPLAEALAAPPPAAQSAPPRRRRFTGLAAGSVLLAAAGVAAWRWPQSPGAAPAGSPRTLAVLPFKPVASGTRDELLEIGMAESLVARLSNVPGVAVRSVGSVRRFGGPEQDPISAARELGVVWIVDGTIQRDGNRVRVSARLLNTASGEAAWSGRFDEDFTGMFEVQDKVSAKVADVLAPHLAAPGRRRLANAGGTRNADAYQLYLTARQHAQGIKSAGLLKSIDLYQQAIALDRSYALAYAGMGESYRRLVFGADGEPGVVLKAAKDCNTRALQIDPELAEAHAGLGWNLFWYDWDWPAAAAAFDRALALNASESNAHLGSSQLLQTLGRDAQALVHLQQARESDPLSLILLTLEAGSLTGAGRIDEGRQRLQRVFDIEPDFWVAHMMRSGLLLHDGKNDEALAALEQADRLADGSSQAAAAWGNLLARKGQPERARAVLARLLEQGRTRYMPPVSPGLVYAGLGENEAAMAALDKGYAVRDPRMTLVQFDGRFKALREDARFAALMRRMKLA